MSSDEPATALVSEETPLLRDADAASQARPNGQESLEERPTKQLILILGSIWVGVFLAALGKCSATFYHCR